MSCGPKIQGPDVLIIEAVEGKKSMDQPGASSEQGDAVAPPLAPDDPPAVAEEPTHNWRNFSPNAIHCVRTVQINTLTLSQLADTKASILLGVTFLVFSLSVSRSLAGNYPTALITLAIFSFLATVCAVIAVLPNVRKAKPSEMSPNPLFFGHFAHLDEAEWTEDVLGELEADESVYRMMLHDIYQNGQVLQKRKYRFLSLAYRIFIAGLCLTIVIFLVEQIRSI